MDVAVGSSSHAKSMCMVAFYGLRGPKNFFCRWRWVGQCISAVQGADAGSWGPGLGSHVGGLQLVRNSAVLDFTQAVKP